jgi:hypothetical protein
MTGAAFAGSLGANQAMGGHPAARRGNNSYTKFLFSLVNTVVNAILTMHGPFISVRL